jgi:hypothetical protein
MGKRTKRFWGKWDCTSCDTRGISGEFKICSSCGNPREKGELANAYVSGSKLNSGRVVGVEEVKTPYVGPDWHCFNCDSGNKGNVDKCKQCGAPAAGNTPQKYSKTFTEKINPPPRNNPKYPPYTPPKTPRNNPPLSPPPSPPSSKAAILVSSGVSTLTVLGGLALAITLIVGIWWGFSSYEIPGEVTGMNWSHTTSKQTFSQYSDNDWRSNLTESRTIMPVNGSGEHAGVNIGSCYQKHHHYEQYQCGTTTEQRSRQVQTGTKEQCSAPKSMGDGSLQQDCWDVPTYSTEYYDVQVPKYCENSIEKPYCSYTSYRWVSSGSETDKGSGKQPREWPTLTVGQHDRLLYTGSWAVRIDYDDTYHTVKPRNERDYLTWNVGDQVTVEKFNIGAVKAVHR